MMYRASSNYSGRASFGEKHQLFCIRISFWRRDYLAPFTSLDASEKAVNTVIAVLFAKLWDVRPYRVCHFLQKSSLDSRPKWPPHCVQLPVLFASSFP